MGGAGPVYWPSFFVVSRWKVARGPVSRGTSSTWRDRNGSVFLEGFSFMRDLGRDCVEPRNKTAVVAPIPSRRGPCGRGPPCLPCQSILQWQLVAVCFEDV